MARVLKTGGTSVSAFSGTYEMTVSEGKARGLEISERGSSVEIRHRVGALDAFPNLKMQKASFIADLADCLAA